MDAIKIKVTNKNEQHHHLDVFESRYGEHNWKFCGHLICDPEIAAMFRDVMFRGQGRWALYWEDLIDGSSDD